MIKHCFSKLKKKSKKQFLKQFFFLFFLLKKLTRTLGGKRSQTNSRLGEWYGPLVPRVGREGQVGRCLSLRSASLVYIGSSRPAQARVSLCIKKQNETKWNKRQSIKKQTHKTKNRVKGGLTAAVPARESPGEAVRWGQSQGQSWLYWFHGSWTNQWNRISKPKQVSVAQICKRFTVFSSFSYLFYVYGRFACTDVSVPLSCRTRESQRRARDSPELAL